jgi:hypothetical protein
MVTVPFLRRTFSIGRLEPHNELLDDEMTGGNASGKAGASELSPNVRPTDQ